MRVSPPRVTPQALGASRPPAGSPGADAHRQTGFVLSREVDHILAGLEVEGAVAAASAGARHRTQVVASVMATWSRAWLARLEGLHAAQGGNYAAAIPLVRSAADLQSAAAALLGPDSAEWQAWLDGGGIAQAPDLHAAEFRQHAFRSAETLAARPALAAVYRQATDLSMPHFGSTLLLAGADSTPDRVAVTFGDRDFHLGLAELVLGWLLALGADQCAAILDGAPAFDVPDEAAFRRWADEARTIVARPDRCRIEPIDHAGEQRLLVQNWRRTPGSAAKRVLL